MPSVDIVMILVGDTKGLWKLPMQHYAKMRTNWIAEHRCLLGKETHRSPTQLHDDLKSVNHNSTIDLLFSHVLSNVLQCSKRYARCHWSVTITPNSTRHNSRFCTSIDCTSLVSPVLILPSQCNSILGRQGKVIRILESGKFWLVDSGIQLKESGIPVMNKIRNPFSTITESGIQSWNPESTASSPQSKIVFNFLVWKNKSPHFTTPSLVSPPNDVWETSAEIPYWWHVTIQFWVVLLIGRAAWEICFSQSEARPRSG